MSLSPPPSRDDLPVVQKNGRTVAEFPRQWIKWFTDIKELLAPVSTGGLLLWNAISKSGSNLTDLTIRNHADLQNVNSSTYTHLTELNHTDLTDGGVTILHKHTHNLEDGLQGGTTDEYYHNTLHEDGLVDIIDTQWSTGVLGLGGLITDGGSGTVNLAACSVLIRATNSDTADIAQYSVTGVTGQALTDLVDSFVYIEYNAGTPQYVVDASQRTDTNTNILIGKVYRDGTAVHIFNESVVRANDNIRRLSRRFVETLPFQRVEGAILAETGTRNISVTAGIWWECSNRFTTNALNTAVSGSFIGIYSDGLGGWTEQAAQTQVDNTYYDDGSGTLAVATANHYLVRWIYIESDSDILVRYGTGDHVLEAAADAEAEPIRPHRIEATGRLIGKIVIRKGDATFTSITNAFDSAFEFVPQNNHNALAGLQGGDAGDYYHLKNTEYHATLNNASTALLSGCTLSINANPALFDIAAGYFRVLNNYTDPANPTFTEIAYAGSTGITVTNLATQDSTYVSIDSAGTVYQTAAKPSGADIRDKVLLGALIHTSHTSISSADSFTEVNGFDVASSLSDISLAVGPINSGNLYSANATNTLRINKSVGTLTQTGINWKNSKQNPNIITCAASTGATFLITWRNGTGGWTTTAATDINPGRYDDGTGGVTQPNGLVANNKWTILKVFYLPNSQLTGIEYGQVVYNSEAEAEAAKGTATTDNPALTFIPFRGWILVRGAATNLNLATDAIFLDAGKFGMLTSGAGTGSSTTTLQGAYDNSTQPQIVTSTTSGAVQIKRGSAADTDVVAEVLNGAGSAVFQVTGQGFAHNTAISLQGGTAGEYYHLTAAQSTDLTDGGDSTLHFHAADRALANITGLGTGVATALGTAVTGSGAMVLATDPQFTHTVGVGTAALATNGVRVLSSLSGNTTQVGVNSAVTFNSECTALGTGVQGNTSTEAAAFTLATLRAFGTTGFTLGAGSAVTTYEAYFAGNETNASNHYSFYGNQGVTNASDRNCAMFGAAPNHFAGAVLIGTNTDDGVNKLQVADGIAATGAIKSSGATSGVGYATGAGGTVTQLTNKSTGVTLNNVCGAITMSNAALAAGATVTFTLTNSVLAAQDVLVPNIDGFPTENYSVRVGEMAAGSCVIAVKNETVGSLSDAVTIRFAVIKVVVA